MSALLLSPHNDDAVLFASWLCLRHRPLVVTVLRSVNQQAAGMGITAAERQNEDAEALAILGCPWRQWPFPDADPDWAAVEAAIYEEAVKHDRVFAPWPEPGGHPDHNRIGEFVADNFADRATLYTTYRFGGPRSTGDHSVPERWMIPLKLRALACYESQMLRGPYRFFLDPLHEWTVTPA